MMTRSHMVPVVLQTVALSACALVVSHHLLSNAIYNASNTELWQNITSTFEGAVNSSAQARFNGTTNNQTSNIDIFFNGTAANNTANDISSSDGSSESFYLSSLPRELFLLTVLSPLYFYWHIWLERFFPGRPSVTALMPAGEKSGLGEGDNHEEEIVQRWIAQGKVRRASLSWWNTFFKWILNLTVGTLWMESLRFLLTEMITGKSLIKVLRMMLGFGIPFRFVGSLFDIRPLASLIAFIVVPAHQRMTFEAGAGLVWNIFFGVFVSVVISWIANARFVQDAVGLWMEAMNNATTAAGYETSGPQSPRLGDEL